MARTFRFRRVGGTSAGAIAAAGAAAAELGRSNGGFERLGQVPQRLGAELAHVFQPSPSTRGAFDLVMNGVSPDRRRSAKGARGALIVLRDQGAWFALVLAALMGLAVLAAWGVSDGFSWRFVVSLALATIPTVLVSFAIALLMFVLAAMRAIALNGFGLCNGQTQDEKRGAGVAPLAEWLTRLFDHLAGLEPDGAPLTFGDLWGPTATAAYRDASPADRAPASRALRDLREIDLEVMTTNLSHGRSHRLPFDDETFMWCSQCLADYLPERLLDQMANTSQERETTVRRGHTILPVCPAHGVPLRGLRAAPDLPVVVAARMSLSFPILISAIPLYAVDFSRRPGKQGVECIWFSDGGISSNFPMHFFDSMWPRRPTFGIDLQDRHPDYENQAWRSTGVRTGIQPRVRPIEGIGGFIGVIKHAMQNWADSALVSMPGFRDRVAVVYLATHEGGLNLRMPEQTIRDLAERGGEAASSFRDFRFDDHRWVRYRVSTWELSPVLQGMLEAYSVATGAGSSYESWLRTHVSANYPDGSEPADAWRAEDLAATDALMETAQAWADADQPSRRAEMPRPRAIIRATPR